MKRYRVCVADDNLDNAEVLREGLDMHGYSACVAHTGQAAIDRCITGEVELLLLDVNLPDINGYEVCRRIKEDPKSSKTAIIFVTVRGSKEDIAEGFHSGAVDYITKPYNLPMVFIRVDSAMRSWALQNPQHGPEEQIHDNAYTDSLTGLHNRRFLDERLHEEVEKAHRYDFPVSCVLFDLDEVKACDEELGPVSLDDLLVELAMILKSYTRSYDILSRYDGTVFAALLPHAPLPRAVGYAKKIMEEIDSITFSDPSFPTEVRLRAGVTCCRNGTAYGAEYVFGEAMRNLLKASSRSEHLVARDLDEQ